MLDRRGILSSLGALSRAGRARGTSTAARTADALPPMLSPRATHAAVAVVGGVLMIGGFARDGEGIAMVERYDIARRRFDRFAMLSARRIQPVAVALAGGDTLAIGGEWDAPVSTAELIAADGRVVPLGAMHDRRTAAAATLLKDGRVLVTGGSRPGYRMTASAELYDRAGRRSAAIAPMTAARAGHSATLLRDGRVLIAGGDKGGAIAATTEMFDPATNRFFPAATMRQPRYKHGAIGLADGSLLIVGGSDDRSGPDGRGRLRDCERYDPVRGRFAAAPDLADARYTRQNAVVALPDGAVVVASGGATAEVLHTGDARAARHGTPGPHALPPRLPRPYSPAHVRRPVRWRRAAAQARPGQGRGTRQ